MMSLFVSTIALMAGFTVCWVCVTVASDYLVGVLIEWFKVKMLEYGV